LGGLSLMWAASASVIGFCSRNRGQDNVGRGQIAPLLAFLLLSGVLAATIIGLGDLLQVNKDSPFQWLFPTAYAIFAVIGFGWALVMRGARPDVYAAIGRGAEGHIMSIASMPPSQRMQVAAADAA